MGADNAFWGETGGQEHRYQFQEQLTLALGSAAVDTDAGNQYIVDNSEAALAAHPLAVPAPYAGIVEDCGFVEQDASAMNRTRKWDLVRVEVVEGGPSKHFFGLVS
jgi:hypothetical protein